MRNGTRITRNKIERVRYTKAVMKTNTEPTIPLTQVDTRTTDDNEPVEKIIKPKRKRNRRSKQNRLKIHFLENWPNYAIGTFLSIAGIFLFTVNNQITTISKDVENHTNSINQNTTNISNINNANNQLQGEIKSLSDRFDLFIQLFSPSIQSSDKDKGK